jgi:putative ABC transport system permease protein
MWRNYLTVGVRALAKNKTYAFINIFGLALGLAACLMILLFVRYELSYDRALPGAAQAYQFQSFVKDPDTGEEDKMQMASYVAKDLLKKDFPQIETAVHALAAGPVILKDGQAFATEDFRFVDGNLLEILQFPLLKGDPKNALSQAGSIVLTQSEAQKYFGAEDPMGQTLTLSARGQQTDYRVTGILKDLPKNTHFAATMLARYDPKSYWADQEEFLTQWGWQSGWIYLKLRPGADANAINGQMNAFEKRNIPDIMFGGQNVNQGDFYDFRLTNIADIHLGEAQGAAMTPGNDRRSIITFAVIAALILAMACVNFTNLATARASQRAREVALRKVLGANRQQLVTQFLAESILVAGLAMLLALAFVELALPLFRRLPRCRPPDALFRRGRPDAADPGPGPAGRRGGRRLPRIVPVALPAGQGAQGQQVLGRGARLRQLAQRAGGRASSPCRSASSSAPPWCTARPFTPAPPIPATSGTACCRSRISAGARCFRSPRR